MERQGYLENTKAKRVLIAHHLVFTGYGHWLPNDPRGSGSDEIRKDDLKDFGEIHFGRKRVQPPRNELRQFSAQAEQRLEHSVLWFDQHHRGIIGDAFSRVIGAQKYSVFACAVLRDHAHLCIRAHRDRAERIWYTCANAAREALCESTGLDHPIWSDRPHTVFLFTHERVRQVIDYIAKNPTKHGLPPQQWGFVKPYHTYK